MQRSDFAPRPLFTAVPAALVAILPTAGVFAQSPRMVAAPGMPVVINDAAATAITISGVKPEKRAIHAVAILDVPPRPTGRADPDWVWLAGLPGPLSWREVTGTPPPAGALELRWADPLIKLDYEAARLTGPATEPRTGGNAEAVELAPPVWLDAVTPGWETLSRAALLVMADVPRARRADLAGSLRAPLATPGDHWRAALLLRAIEPTTPAAPEFELPALGALARQQGDMWAGAIGRLSRADGALALRLAQKLVRVAYLPASDTTGRWAVLWADPDPRLLEALISLPMPSAVAAANNWLLLQPGAIGWVRDDAGLRDALSNAAAVTVAAVSLLDHPAVGGLSLGGDPVAFNPLVGQVLTGVPPVGAATVSVTIGRQPINLSVAPAAVPAVPPGVLIGPFYRDWTMPTLRAQQQVARGGVAGSLVQTPPAAPATRQVWTLYLECRTEVPGGDTDTERLRIWLGPTGTPVACVDVTPDGKVTRHAGAQGTLPQVSVSRVPGGWCASLKLPEGTIEPSGVVRLAVEHTAADGLRATWPRPQLPWQTEPGRTAIDTAAWDRDAKP